VFFYSFNVAQTERKKREKKEEESFLVPCSAWKAEGKRRKGRQREKLLFFYIATRREERGPFSSCLLNLENEEGEKERTRGKVSSILEHNFF